MQGGISYAASVGLETISRLPRKQKINLEKVMAPQNTACTKCGCSITPDKIRRVDFQRVECPECGERFVPAKHGELGQ
jgi:ribosomal protein S27AE